jgi:hypothetical protein
MAHRVDVAGAARRGEGAGGMIIATAEGGARPDCVLRGTGDTTITDRLDPITTATRITVRGAQVSSGGATRRTETRNMGCAASGGLAASLSGEGAARS